MNRNLLKNEYPFEENFLDLNGLQYHYVDEGDQSGNPVLFVHGNPTWSFAWRNLIKGLDAKHRAIAVDHIGCGLSDKPQQYSYTLSQHIDNLCTLIETLDLKNITLVAHDWGGAIGVGATGKLPDRFQKIVLMNTAAFPSQRIPLRIAVCRLPLLGSLGMRGFNLFAKAAVTMAIEKPLSKEVAAGFLAPYSDWKSRVAIDRFVKDIPLNAKHTSYATLKKVEAALEQWKAKPAMLFWGMKDWCFSPHFLRTFQERLPDAKTIEVANAGHYVFEDACEQLVTELNQFLN